MKSLTFRVVCLIFASLTFFASNVSAAIKAPTSVEAGSGFAVTWGAGVGPGAPGLPTTLMTPVGSFDPFTSPRPVVLEIATPGTYSLSERYCFFIFFSQVCSTISSRQLYVVSPASPNPPDDLSAQIQYEYELRSGDFDSDGDIDVLVDRLTPGGVDGSLRTLILKQSPGFDFVTDLPTTAELNVARSYPVNSSLNANPTDFNYDGYADLYITGFSTISSSLEDEYVVFASGENSVANPLGIAKMDDEKKAFFGDIRQWVENKNYFAVQAAASVRPVIGFVPVCFLVTDWIPRLCVFQPVVIGFVSVGGSTPPFVAAAKNFTDAMQLILDNNDVSGGADWWQLSQAFEAAIGVHAFGFRSDGSRETTNYGTHPNEEFSVIRLYLQTIFLPGADSASTNPNTWPRHDYEVETFLCNRFLNPNCTLEQAWCWAKKFPAPRDTLELRTAQDGELEDLMPLLQSTPNPIRVHVDDATRTLINETQPGHDFHDPLAQNNCAIQQPSPPQRCAWVRRTVENGLLGDIVIKTHGEGHNPSKYSVLLNEVIGDMTFGSIDQFISIQLAIGGTCVDDP